MRLVLAILPPAALHAQAKLEETSVNTTAAVRLRERPDSSSRVVARVAAKTLVYVTSCANGWCQVSYRELAGYVPRRFLSGRATLQHSAAARPRGDSLHWEPPTVTSQDLWKVIHAPTGVDRYTKLELPAVAPALGPIGEFRPVLDLTCYARGLTAYVNTMSTLVADSNKTTVRLYWGRSAPAEARWIVSTDHSAAFPPETGAFVMNLLSNQDLGLELRFFDDVARTVSFSTRGLAGHLAELEAQCPCLKGITWTAVRCTEKSAGNVYVEMEVDEAPRLVSGPALEYPAELRAMGIEGHVIVDAIVDTSGHVEPESVNIVSGANPEFDEASRRFVLAALFRPARIDGRAVRVRVHIPVNFTIRRDND